jgi:hypothetical protein
MGRSNLRTKRKVRVESTYFERARVCEGLLEQIPAQQEEATHLVQKFEFRISYHSNPFFAYLSVGLSVELPEPKHLVGGISLSLCACVSMWTVTLGKSDLRSL